MLFLISSKTWERQIGAGLPLAHLSADDHLHLNLEPARLRSTKPKQYPNLPRSNRSRESASLTEPPRTLQSKRPSRLNGKDSPILLNQEMAKYILKSRTIKPLPAEKPQRVVHEISPRAVNDAIDLSPQVQVPMSLHLGLAAAPTSPEELAARQSNRSAPLHLPTLIWALALNTLLYPLPHRASHPKISPKASRVSRASTPAPMVQHLAPLTPSCLHLPLPSISETTPSAYLAMNGRTAAD